LRQALKNLAFPMTSRRQFLVAGAAASLFKPSRARAAKTAGSDYPYAEFDARIARRDFRDITKDVLPTPAMIVDLDLFEKNVKTMADHAKATGIHVRPHVKIHKSVDVARRQIAQGAIGLTCATMAEAELMSGAGIKHVLWTKQPAGVNNISRAVALSKKDPTFMFVVDDPQVVDWVEEAAAARNARLKIAVSVFAGLTRQGIAAGQPALELAQKVAASPRHLKLVTCNMRFASDPVGKNRVNPSKSASSAVYELERIPLLVPHRPSRVKLIRLTCTDCALTSPVTDH